jgi:multiple sugar transport system permease protein
MVTATGTLGKARHAPPRSEKPAHRRWPAMVGFYVLMAILSLFFILPFIWMISTSFKTASGATAAPPQWIPHPASTNGYETLFTSTAQAPVLRWFVNSMVAAVGNVLLILATATPAAYALARLRFKGKGLMFGVIVATLFVPPIIFLMPNFVIVERLGWLDTLWAVIVPSAAAAFGVFLLRQFFVSLPAELEEAALIDGANRWQIFWGIMVPLARPALATLAVLAFLTNWNDFLWPIYVLFNPQNLTLPPGLAILQGAYTIDYAVIMAGGVIAAVPAIAIFVIAQRHIIQGVSRSGLKG